MNMTQGAFSFAFSKRERTRAAPTPTNISINSEPLALKKGTFASAATAFAKRVFPVPGLPSNKTPLGTFAPASLYFVGDFRKSTISTSSNLASSHPATSAKETFKLLPSTS